MLPLPLPVESLRRTIPVLLALGAASCGPGSPFAPPTDPWTLQRGRARASLVEVTLPNPQMAERFRLRFPLPDDDAPPPFAFRLEEDERHPAAVRIVVGTAADAEALALAKRLGLELLEGGGFRLLGRDFEHPGDAVHAVFEDPDRRGRPVGLWFGNEDERLALFVQDLHLGWRPSLRAWMQGEVALECPLEVDGTPRAEEAIDFRAAQRAVFAGAVTATSGPLSVMVVGPVRPKALRRYGRVVIRARKRVLGWLGPGAEAPLNVAVYARPEDLARVTGAEEAPVVNAIVPGVHVLLAPGLPDDRGAAGARATALEVGGEPASPWMLDGVAVCAADAWWQRPLEGWVGGLAAGGLVPEIAEIIDPSAPERYSPHLLQPLRGFLMRTLLATRGPRRLEGLWSGAVPFEADRFLRIAWKKALVGAARKAAASPRHRNGGRRAAAARDSFRHGVALVEESDTPVSGYLREGAAESLGRARVLGADSFSLTVFATHETVRSPHPFGGTGPVRGSTSDLALAHAMSAGRALHMRPLLVVEPLVASSGAREQGYVLRSKEDWGAFFTDFEAIAVHYGLLAELLMCDVLCLGTEFPSAARTLPDEDSSPWVAELCDLRLAGWRRVIEATRKVFTGALTYGAQGPWDAIRVGFWEDLDFVGTVLFPTWKETEEGWPTRERVRGAYRRQLLGLAELAVTARRPGLVLQVGFPSTADAWPESWAPAGPVSTEAQREAYEALTQALRNGGRGHPELRGTFLWCWSTDPEAGGPADRGFTPQNKEAEEVLPLLFATPR